MSNANYDILLNTGNKPKLFLSINEVCSLLSRNRQFVEVCIKHKLLTAWEKSKTNNPQSNRKKPIQIPVSSFNDFYNKFSKPNFFDKLTIDAKNDLAPFLLPNYELNIFKQQEIKQDIVSVGSDNLYSNLKVKNFTKEQTATKKNQVYLSLN